MSSSHATESTSPHSLQSNSFYDLAQRLITEHERVVSANVGLQSEIAVLQARANRCICEAEPGMDMNGNRFHGLNGFDADSKPEDLMLHWDGSAKDLKENLKHLDLRDLRRSRWARRAHKGDVEGGNGMPRLCSGDSNPQRPSNQEPLSPRVIEPESPTAEAHNGGGRLGSKRSAAAALWPVWTRTSRPNDTVRRAPSTRSSLVQVQLAKYYGGDSLKDNSCLQPMVTGPSSRRRVFWDMVSVLVVSWDVLTVPLLAFSPMDEPYLQAVGMCTTGFWSLDIPFSFLSGFYDGSVIEMRPSRIAKRYLRLWFPLDVFIVMVDWVLFVVQSGLTDVIGLVRGTKALRIWRILRLLRLLRVLKVPALLDDVVNYFESEALITVVSIARSLVLLGVVNHFIACGWYSAGLIMPDSQGRSWVADLDAEDRGLPYRYTTALHWSLTQFTPASMEIVPRNTVERIYTIAVLLGAMVVFSTFVSSITTSMTTLRTTTADKSRQRTNLRKYISENKISITLAGKITAYGRSHKMNPKRRIHESDIAVFSALPENLRAQLHWEVYSARISWHPFFHHFCQADIWGVFELCHRAMSEMSMPAHKELFAVDEKAEKVWLILAGYFEYFPDNNESCAEEVTANSWVCEVALWLQWTHKGRLSASTNCELVSLEASQFRKIAALSPTALPACCEYAKRYRDFILTDIPARSSKEIWYSFDALQELAQTSFSNVTMTFDPQLYLKDMRGASQQQRSSLSPVTSPQSNRSSVKDECPEKAVEQPTPAPSLRRTNGTTEMSEVSNPSWRAKVQGWIGNERASPQNRLDCI